MGDPVDILGVVYHYCSVNALCSIVKDGRFRLSNIFFMNDYMEVEWLKKIACDVITEIKGQSTAGTALQGFLDVLTGRLSRRVFDHVYCGCFSMNRDDIGQWRAYADDGRGVCIGFDLRAIRKANRWSSPTEPVLAVTYGGHEAKKQSREVLLHYIGKHKGKGLAATRRWAALVHAVLRDLAPKYKNAGFEVEKEVRLIAQYSGTRGGYDMDFYPDRRSSGLPSDIDFYERRGRLIPFVAVRIPPEAIMEVVLGPRADKLDASVIKIFLEKHKVPAQVSPSKISYGNG